MDVGKNYVSIIETELENFRITEYTIGRLKENSIAIENQKVSRRHARLIECSPSSFILEDLGSLNGTYVNGLRISRKLIDVEDKIRFAETEYILKELLLLHTSTQDAKKTAKKKDPLDFTEEFAALKEVYEQYPQLKKAYRSRDKTIRTGSILLSSLIGVGAVLASGGTLPVLQLMSGAGLGMLIPALSSTFLSTEEKLELLEKEYRSKYRCPNPSCHDLFIGREYESLAEQKICRKCKAVWVD